MANRRLQTEIDRVLKRVGEGVIEFQQCYEKLFECKNAGQKDKVEQELKKEIKKLQRYRDQIKTWIASSEVKDKTSLLENRQLIETQMERFKHCEKDVKIKPYSKEGLNMREKIDPKEVDRRELIEWIAARIADLKLQIEKLEAEAEQLTNMTRKGRKDIGKTERFTAVEGHIEHERWHLGRLELINRLLENCTVDTEKGDKFIAAVTNIKDDVEYYVHNNQEGIHEAYEDMYDELSLEEEEELYKIGEFEYHDNHDSTTDGSSTPQDISGMDEKDLESCIAALPNGKRNAGVAEEELVSPSRSKANAQQRKYNDRKAKDDSTGARSQKPTADAKSTTSAVPSSVAMNAKMPSEVPAPLPQRYAVAAAASPTVAAVVAGQARTVIPMATTSAKTSEHVAAATVVTTPNGQASEQRSSRGTAGVRSEHHPVAPAENSAKSAPTTTVWKGNANTITAATAVASGGGQTVTPTRERAKAQDAAKNTATPVGSHQAGPNQPQPMEQPLHQRQQGPTVRAKQRRSSSRGRTASGTMAAPALLPQSTTAAATASLAAGTSGKPATASARQGHVPATTMATTSSTSPKPTTATSVATTNTASTFVTTERKQQAPTSPSAMPPSNLSAPFASAKHSQTLPMTAAPASNGVASPAPQQPPQPATQSFPDSPTSNPSSVGSAKSVTPDYVPRQALALPPLPSPEPLPVSALPQSLGDLAKGFEAAMQRNAKEDALYIKQMLSMGLQSAPNYSDAERIKPYVPRQPWPVPPHYPQAPGQISNSPEIFERIDIDCLFFIFYHMPKTYHQYLAARELKRQSWRFHTGYRMWFQRDDEPELSNEDFEQGTYIWFDHESTWCQRKKSDFRFEYKYLED